MLDRKSFLGALLAFPATVRSLLAREPEPPPLDIDAVIARPEVALAPTVDVQTSLYHGIGTLSLVVDDPHGVVTRIRFGGADIRHPNEYTVDTLDPGAPVYVRQVRVDPDRVSAVEWSVAYRIDGVQRSISGVEVFDSIATPELVSGKS